MVVALAHVIFVLAVGRSYGFSVDLRAYDGFTLVVTPFLGFAWLVAALLTTLWRDRPRNPIAHLRLAMSEWRIGQRLVLAVPVLVVAPLFFGAFTSMKVNLSAVVPFSFDPLLADLDRQFHGGTDPWLLLQPVFAYGPVTVVIDFLYGLWLFVVFAVLFAVTFMLGNDRLRARYLLAIALVWALLGNVAATLLASVGPCFYATFYDADPFAALTAYLAGNAIVSVETQQMLIANHQAGQIGAGLGISAMPSVHVAVAFLNVLLAAHFSRALFWLALAFFAAILVGSVHLGWHYAVDGYASIVATALIWYISGLVANRLYDEPVAAA